MMQNANQVPMNATVSKTAAYPISYIGTFSIGTTGLLQDSILQWCICSREVQDARLET